MEQDNYKISNRTKNYKIQTKQKASIFLISNYHQKLKVRLMSLLSSQYSDYQEERQCKDYSDLIKKVGDHGRYQNVIFFIFCVQWFISGFYILSTGFMYLNPIFGCSNKGLLVQNCFSSVCKLNQSQWPSFVQPKQVQSLATEFGPFYCQQQQKLSVMKTVNYVGSFIGVFIFAFLSDNFGRKSAIIIAEASICTGLTLLCVSQNIYMASLGFLLLGAGNKAILRITGVFLSEVFQRSDSQRKNILVCVIFALGGVFVGIMFYILKDWRLVTIATTLPSFIVLYFLIFYLVETPKFLLRKDLSKALKQLNKMGKINLKQDNILNQQDLKNVITFQESTSTQSKTYTAIDLFRFKSLRKVSFWGPITIISINFLYLAPITIIGSFGFNSYLTQIVLCVSQMVSYLLVSLKINKIARVKSNQICLFFALVFNCLVFFINKPQECDNCIQGIAQLFFIFLMRFAISIAYGIFIVHMIQVFPQSIRGTGSSFSNGFGDLSSIFGPIILELIRQNGFNQLIIFPLISALGMVAVSFLPETLNKPLKTQIDQISETIRSISEKQISKAQ